LPRRQPAFFLIFRPTDFFHTGLISFHHVLFVAITPYCTNFTIEMAKSPAKTPSKKSAKTAKAAATSGEAKKKRRSTRVESYSTYIYKV
jgi:hypothetical protein